MSTSGASIYSSVNNWHNPTTRGLRKHCSGGTSFVSIHSYLTFTHSQPFRKVFGDPPGTNGNRRPEVRDIQRPSMRERVENERQERVRAAALAPE